MPRPEDIPPAATNPNPAARYDFILPEALAEGLRTARAVTRKPDWRATIGEHDMPGEVRIYQGVIIKGIFPEQQGALNYLGKVANRKKS